MMDAVLIRDERQSDRIEADANAYGLFSNSQGSTSCHVVDISETGARIDIGKIDIVPKRFKIFVPKYNTEYECEVVWRLGGECGVTFVQREEF